MIPLLPQHGKRIRPTDKGLLFRFAFGSLASLFLAIFLLLNIQTLLRIDWSAISLFGTNDIPLNVPYLAGSAAVTALICFGAAHLFYFFKRDFVKRLEHRQKLAKMILENGWYESEKTSTSGFFKDLSSNTKEKITYFPKMYYRMENGELRIRVEITMGKYQEQLLHLEKKLETGLYCELVDKILLESWIEYTLLYDMIGRRISIENVRVEKGKMSLMETIWWAFDELPHMLIAGGTGGGKSYFILTIILALLRTRAIIYILDPKNADLADLGDVMPNVYYRKDDMIECLTNFYEEMMAFNEGAKKMPGYKTGENYAYMGLAPHFLVFDEYVAFMEMLSAKEREDVLAKLKQIVMLGRQAGFFLILACQRPDAKYLGDGIRDQFNFRVALGRMSELGYSMMFGETTKDFFLKPIRGRGYVDVGTNVISEFYTPLVPKGFDFMKEIGSLAAAREANELSYRPSPPVIPPVKPEAEENENYEGVYFNEDYD